MKRLLVLVMCVMFMGSGSVFAGVNLPKQSWHLGPEISYINYKEPDMRERGTMYGIVGSYTYHNQLMLKVYAKGSLGWVDYKGSYWDGTPMKQNDIRDYMLEFRGLAGYDFPVRETVFTPYTGFGYRYLNDDLGSYEGGYERESNYFYSPIGIETTTKIDDGWFIGATLEYDYFWEGIQKSHLSDVLAGLNDVTNYQHNGYGLRGSIKIQGEDEGLNLLMEPFIKYWHIEKSDMKNLTYNGANMGEVYEPRNHSTEIGVKIAVKF